MDDHAAMGRPFGEIAMAPDIVETLTDSPLHSLALRNPDLAGLVDERQPPGIRLIVDLCLQERVVALVIAGDLFDGEQTSMKTARFLAAQITRLHFTGIRLLSAQSRRPVADLETDAFSGHGDDLRGSFPIGATDDGRVGRHVPWTELRAPDSLLPNPAAREGVVNIGIIHQPGRITWSRCLRPCTWPTCMCMAFDYSALGQIHARQVHPGPRAASCARPFSVASSLNANFDLYDPGPDCSSGYGAYHSLMAAMNSCLLCTTPRSSSSIRTSSASRSDNSVRSATSRRVTAADDRAIVGAGGND